jgi:sulfur relay (sulfurtransferase) DsrF/TusC family protein
MSDFMRVLEDKDIQEKINLNLKKGLSLWDIRDSLICERHLFQRSIIRQQVQVQNLNEQIDYVAAMIDERPGTDRGDQA